MTKNSLIEALQAIEGNPEIFFREHYDDFNVFPLDDLHTNTYGELIEGAENKPEAYHEGFDEDAPADDEIVIVLTT